MGIFLDAAERCAIGRQSVALMADLSGWFCAAMATSLTGPEFGTRKPGAGGDEQSKPRSVSTTNASQFFRLQRP